MILLLINTWKCEWFDAIKIVIVCWIIFFQCSFFRSILLMIHNLWMNRKHDFRIKKHKIVWKSSRNCTIVKRWCISLCVHVNNDFWNHFLNFWSKFNFRKRIFHFFEWFFVMSCQHSNIESRMISKIDIRTSTFIRRNVWITFWFRKIYYFWNFCFFHRHDSILLQYQNIIHNLRIIIDF